jgi:uncharacterized membrane protein YgdD (TMEM256/DUF423 family)
MHKGFLKTAFLFAATAVILGAFGAHGLKKIISESSLQIFETGVRYQMYHAFGLMIAAIIFSTSIQKRVLLAGRLFITGIFTFSGSLYFLALTGDKFRFVGAITPIGGSCFIVGWILLFAATADKKISL